MEDIEQTSWLQLGPVTRHVSVGHYKGETLIFQGLSSGDKLISISSGRLWVTLGSFWQTKKVGKWMATRFQGCDSSEYEAKSRMDAINYILEEVS